MHKHLSLAAVSLLLTLQASPILTHAQVVTVKYDYSPFYMDGYNYKDNGGVATADLEWDVTQKMTIQNNSVNVNMNTFHYIHFWDSSDIYLGHYATSTGGGCNVDCLGILPASTSTSYAVPIPPNAATFALGRFDRVDADYAINGITLIDFYESTTNYYENNNIAIDELNGKTLTQMYPSTLINTLQLVSNGDFSNGTTGWINEGFQSFTVTNGIASLVANSQNDHIYKSFTPTINDKYYLSAMLKSDISTSTDVQVQFYLYKSPYTNVVSQYITSDNTWQLLSGIGIISETYTHILRIIDRRASGFTQIDGDYTYLFNVSTFITNKVYSPLFNTTFDLMSDANIKTQLDTWVLAGLDNVPLYYYATALSYVPTLTVADFIEYYNFYQWNRTSTFGFTDGIFQYITEKYYADSSYQYVWNLTEIFGSGSEPSQVDLNKYDADYQTFLSHSNITNITETAWLNQEITYNQSYWDDQVGESVTNGFILVMSGAVTFILMFLGFKTRAKLFNLLAIPGAIWFTIQGGASLPIILVGFGLVIMNALYFAKVD